MNIMDELKYRADRLKSAFNNPVGSTASMWEDRLTGTTANALAWGGIGVGVAGAAWFGAHQFAGGLAGAAGALGPLGYGLDALILGGSIYAATKLTEPIRHGRQIIKKDPFYARYAERRAAMAGDSHAYVRRAKKANLEAAKSGGTIISPDEMEKEVNRLTAAEEERLLDPKAAYRWRKDRELRKTKGYQEWIASQSHRDGNMVGRYKAYSIGKKGLAAASWIERKASAIPARILGRMGGPVGLGNVAMHAAMTGVGIGAQVLKDVEGLSRGLLTKSFFGNGKTPLDDWFPHFNSQKLDKHDFRRLAPNPRIARRLIAGNLILGAGQMIHEAISPAAPPPTMFFDGLHMHHRNDMGTGGRYGSTILGSNSDLNLSGDDIARVLPHLF